MLTEGEVLSKHEQSLGEARRACQHLGRSADPEIIVVRGPHYRALKLALEELEGSARQMATYRSDARWLRLGILYGGTLIMVKNQWGRRNWPFFGKLTALFVNGLKHLDDLRNRRTGVLASKPILPQNASSWLHVPKVELMKPAGFARQAGETVH